MSLLTPRLSLPYVEPTDAITDYPALDHAAKLAIEGAIGLTKLYDSIDAGLTLPASSIDITGIPATYKHLVLDYEIDTSSAWAQILLLRMNNDTGANYNWEYSALYGGSGVVAGSGNQGDAAIGIGQVGVKTYNLLGHSGRIIIPNYAQAVRWKSAWWNHTTAFDGTSINNQLQIGSAIWKSIAAINRLTISGCTFKAGSRVTLYGEA